LKLKGDLALDDYLFKETACEPMGNCDFEEDLCKLKKKSFKITKNLIFNNFQAHGTILNLELILNGKLGVVRLQQSQLV
jgi:hypothetical protein